MKRFLTTVLFAASLATAALADQPAMVRYIMMLHQPGAPGAPKEVREPDVAARGGRVLQRVDQQRVIEIPAAAAAALRRDQNVLFLQRVWMGESFDTWKDEPGGDAGAAGGDELRAVEDAESNLTWQTGTFLYDGAGNITGRTVGRGCRCEAISAGLINQAMRSATRDVHRNCAHERRNGRNSNDSVHAVCAPLYICPTTVGVASHP